MSPSFTQNADAKEGSAAYKGGHQSRYAHHFMSRLLLPLRATDKARVFALLTYACGAQTNSTITIR